MSEPTVEIRRLAVYALGQCTEEWATDLLIAALTDPATQNSAAESLGGLGEDAVVLIEDLLRSRSSNAQLTRACIEVAGIIGTAGAVRAIMPLLWSNVALDAAWQTVRLLWLPEVRSALESGEVAVPKPPVAQHDDLTDWAFPWLPEAASNLRACYSRLSRVFIKAAEQAREIELEALPPDLLVPILITLGKSGRALRQAEAHSGYPESDAKVAATQSIWNEIASELSGRTDDKNRVLWSQVDAEDKEDLILPSPVSRAVWIIATLGLIAIMVRGATNHLLSWWWFILPGLWLGFLCYISIDEHDFGNFSYFGLPSATPSLILNSWSRLGRQDRMLALLITVEEVSLITCAAVSTLRLGGYWLALTCVLIPTFLPTQKSGAFDTQIVLYTRSNPLRRLRNALSARADGGFAALPQRPVFKGSISPRSGSTM